MDRKSRRHVSGDNVVRADRKKRKFASPKNRYVLEKEEGNTSTSSTKLSVFGETSVSDSKRFLPLS